MNPFLLPLGGKNTEGRHYLSQCLRVSLAIETHDSMALLQRTTFNSCWLTVQRFSAVCHGGKPGSIQSDVVLEEDLRVLSGSGSAGSRESEPL